MIVHGKQGCNGVAAYEELRSHVLAGSPGGPHFGAIVLLREGIAAWIERGVAREGVPAGSTQPWPLRPAPCDAFHAEMAYVLADIALKRGEEMNYEHRIKSESHCQPPEAQRLLVRATIYHEAGF
jgi:hypothetical protein